MRKNCKKNEEIEEKSWRIAKNSRKIAIINPPPCWRAGAGRPVSGNEVCVAAEMVNIEMTTAVKVFLEGQLSANYMIPSRTRFGVPNAFSLLPSFPQVVDSLTGGGGYFLHSGTAPLVYFG